MLSTTSTGRPPHILVIGGAYGGMSVITNLVNLFSGNPQLSSPIPIPELGCNMKVQPRITLLDERDGIYHSMGSPLVQTSSDFATEAWLPFKEIPAMKHCRHIQGTAMAINTAERIATYFELSGAKAEKTLAYDYLVVATGTRRGWPIIPQALEKVKYLKDNSKHIESIRDAKRVVIVGGGAVGVEFAAEIKLSFPQTEVFLVHSRARLLSAEPLPESFKARAAEMLSDLGVNLLLGCRVNGDEHSPNNGFKTTLSLSNGTYVGADKVVSTCSPHTARTQFLPAKALDADEYVVTKPTLQFPATVPNGEFHYAVGDAVSWTGIKRVGNAFIMGQLVATNIMRQISGSSMREQLVECPDMKPMMALSIGKTALVFRGEGEEWAEESQEIAVGRGMGIDVCSNYLNLRGNEMAIAAN